jgi:Family of unknown function (DUF6364)
VKERLNLTIDGALLEAMKAYAASKEMSVSELVESYFRSVTKPVGRDNILDLMDRLPAPGGRGEEEERVTAEVVKDGGGAIAVVEADKGLIIGEAAKEGESHGF